MKVHDYSDYSFQSDIDDSKSYSIYNFALNGSVVSQKSFKQDTTSNSTIEAKYISTSEAAKKVFWIKKFITKVGVVSSIIDLVALYYDNNRAIS